MRTITIGRGSHCDILIPNEKISREHARISLVGNRYVFQDTSSNGSTLNGQIIHNERIEVAPGAPILLAGNVPLPWKDILAMLPPGQADPYGRGTVLNPPPVPPTPNIPYQPAVDPYATLEVGWGLLAFFIPIAGWIMYFCWKDKTPKKASQAAMWAWIGFGVGLLWNLLLLS